MPSIPYLASLIIGGASALNLAKYAQFKKQIAKFKKSSKKSSYPLSYISLFTGIGGFEVGISKVFPNAKCLGYAEIDKDKISIYQKHFPNHENLGDIFSINRPLTANLLVGGFSCKSRSNIGATSREGKPDISFDTFYGTLKILKNSNIKNFILENVPSKGKSALSNDEIIRELKKVTGRKVYSKVIDTCLITGAYRKRIFFTSFPIVTYLSEREISKRFEFNLDPYDIHGDGFTESPSDLSKQAKIPSGYKDPFDYKQNLIAFMNNEKSNFNRWPFASDTLQDCARTVLTRAGTYPSGLIIDRRGEGSLIRYLSVEEGVRLLGFPKGYLSGIPKTKAFKGLGDSVSPIVVEYLMENLLINIENK